MAAVLLRSWRSGQTAGHTARSAARILGVPVLVGLFGLAVALGTLGRSWSGPATLLSHLDAWGTAAVAALTSVAVNNLPGGVAPGGAPTAAPLRAPHRSQRGPEPVRDRLAGLDPVAAGRPGAGGHPEVRRASLLGLVTVPLAIAAAVGVLLLSGAS